MTDRPLAQERARAARLGCLVVAAATAMLLGCGSSSDSGVAARAPGSDAGPTDTGAWGPNAEDTGTAHDDAAPDGPDGATEGGTTDRSQCKRGVAYGHHSEADLAALSTAVSWWYNWTHVPDSAVSGSVYGALGVEYVPMVWGAGFDPSTVAAEIPDGARTLLGFNEPNSLHLLESVPARRW